MISLQRSMHSSQMYTPGPAMSFLTCFWDFPQKEHFRRSESPNFAIFSRLPDLSKPVRPGGQTGPPGRGVPILRASRRRGSKFGLPFSGGDDLVDDPVLLGLLGRHDEVTVRIVRDLLEGLPGVLGQDLVEQLPVTEDLLGLDLDVHGLALRAAVRLVDQDPGVRQGEPLAPRTGRQEP